MATIGGNNSYYIYIRQQKEVIHKHVWSQKPSGVGGGNGHVKPRNTSTFSKVPSAVPGSNAINSILDIVKNGASVASIAKAGIAVAKTTQKVQETVSKINNYVASQSGDYSFAMQWDDWAQTQKNIMHPVSGYVNSFFQKEAWAKENQRVSEQRTLLGDTAINTLTKGV